MIVLSLKEWNIILNSENVNRAMYLATKLKNNLPIYQLRVSCKRDDGSYYSKMIFDLGRFPAAHFSILDEHIILFTDQLLAAVERIYEDKSEQWLEKILWPFFPPFARDRLGRFRERSSASARYYGPLRAKEKEAIRHEIHIFDKRRLYYLRYGAVDQTRIAQMHEKLCRPLLGQCRDEREYFFIEAEKDLKPGSYLQYIYAIFNLQRYFTQSFATWLPEALTFTEMADHLEEDICLLQRDSLFWKGEETCSHSLHPHLQRYLLMFYDYQPDTRSFTGEYGRQFQDQYRQFRWPERKSQASPERIEELFGQSRKSLLKLSRKELTKIYRQKAMAIHPDQGGEHEQFIELTEIYQELSAHIRE